MRRDFSSLTPLPALLLGLAFCGGGPADETPVPDQDTPAASSEEEAQPEEPEGHPYAVIKTREGPIEIKLRPDLAPKTVENFIRLAEENFYYKTLFHRVIPGTIIQGGDPNSRDNNPYNDGQGNSGTFLPAEFSREPFQRGTVAMARSSDPNSASCQFFICLKRMAQWDGDYTVFGEVTEGIELADKWSRSPRSKDPRLKDRPTANLTIQDIAIEYRPES